jgi:hypothetical protein
LIVNLLFVEDLQRNARVDMEVEVASTAVEWSWFNQPTSDLMTIVAGAMTCLLSALFSMGVINGEPSQGAVVCEGRVQGPFTYRQVQQMYSPLAFKQVPFDELLCATPDSIYILHSGSSKGTCLNANGEYICCTCRYVNGPCTRPSQTTAP